MAGDWIRIRRIRLYGYHGVHAWERVQGQIFEVDIDLLTDLRRAGVSDAVEDTIDYVDMYGVVKRVVTGAAQRLLETVAETVARELLRSFPAHQVVVRIRKPQVRMPGPVDTVEIEITRP